VLRGSVAVSRTSGLLDQSDREHNQPSTELVPLLIVEQFERLGHSVKVLHRRGDQPCPRIDGPRRGFRVGNILNLDARYGRETLSQHGPRSRAGLIAYPSPDLVGRVERVGYPY
jgi:hypothetical protein